MTTFVHTRAIDPRRLSPKPVVPLLTAAGLDVEHRLDAPLRCAPTDTVLVVGNVRSHPRLWRSLAALPRERRPFVALWHTEPLPLPEAAGLRAGPRQPRERLKLLLRDPRANDPRDNCAQVERLARAGLPALLVTGHRSGQRLLRERGIAAEWAPAGYRPDLGRDVGIDRDIDVLFLGTTHARRRRRLIGSLRRAGVDVRVAGRWGDPRYQGAERARLINRARILLHIGQRPGEMAHLRFALGMGNGALVVSEPVWDPAPYVDGEHYLSAPAEDLPGVIAAVLDDDARRQRLAAAGRRFATERVTLERSVERLAGWIRQRHRTLAAAG